MTTVSHLVPICLTDASGQVLAVADPVHPTKVNPTFISFVDENGFVLDGTGTPTTILVAAFTYGTLVNNVGQTLSIGAGPNTTLYGGGIKFSCSTYPSIVSNPLYVCLADSSGLVIGGTGGESTMVAPPMITGDAFVGGILYVDEGLDSPTTTYTFQWVSGPTVTPTTPISGQTGISYTAGAIAGDYVRCAVTPANGEPVRYTNVVRIHAATMTAPILSRTSASGGSPFTYTVTYDNTVFADDIERVQYASDIDFTTILWDATRGLTEAAFVSPFLSDDSADADPAWSTAPPTFTGTYFVRRKVIALELFGGLQVESNWSEPISNFNIDPTVKFNPSASFTTSIFSDNNYTFSGSDLILTAGSSTRPHVAVVNYMKSGKRTAEISVTTLPANAWVGVGFDDGSYNWAGAPGNDGNVNKIDGNGWKGAWAGWIGYAWNHYKADGTTTTGGSDVGGNDLAAGDRVRGTFTPGTFTGATPNNDGILVVSRIRAGTEVTIMTITGISSFAAKSKLIVAANRSAVGTLTATAIPSPAIPGDSQEYQA